MTFVPPDLCAYCGEELPDRGNAMRRVPRLGGKKRRVHQVCALKIDDQGTLELGEPQVKRDGGFRARRIA